MKPTFYNDSHNVSVICPSYNSSPYIRGTLESLQAQTFENWEMLIVDDCSTDNSVEIIQEFAKRDDRIKLIKLEKNSGAAVARNKAIEVAQGRYIAFLDSDDLWLPNKLEKQIEFMQQNSVPFSYSAYQQIDEAGNFLKEMSVPKKVSYHDILKSNSIGCLTAIYDTDYFGKVYMPLIRKRQDLGLWLKLLEMSDYAYGLQENLAQYRVHSNSISANKLSAANYQWQLYREVLGFNFFKSTYYFMHYAVKGFIKTKL